MLNFRVELSISTREVTDSTIVVGVDIGRKISNDYRFLGGKAECEKYIKEMLIRKPKEKYVNRTVLRKHNLNDENMKDAKYVSSYEKVEY